MEKKIRSIGIWGYYGNANFGDDILLHFLVLELKRKFPNTVINATVKDTNNIDPIMKMQINCNEHPKKAKNKIVRIYKNFIYRAKFVKKNDLVIFGGGTSLFEIEKKTYQTFLIKFIVLLLNNIVYKNKVIHLGVGIGEIKTRFSRWLFKRILLFSDIIMLRDKKSYEIVRETVGNKKKVILGHDLSFLRERDLIKYKKGKSAIKIGISVFQYYNYILTDKDMAAKFEIEVIDLIRYLLKIKDSEIFLFSFQRNIGGKDFAFNEKLLLKIEDQRVKHIKYENDHTIDFLNSLSEMDLCIGMRYHFCLLSLQNKIRTIGINYQPKVKNEFEGLQLENLCVEIDEISRIPQLIEHNNLVSVKIGKEYMKAFDEIDKRFVETKNIVDSILMTL